jgi:hypothetical protein
MAKSPSASHQQQPSPENGLDTWDLVLLKQRQSREARAGRPPSTTNANAAASPNHNAPSLPAAASTTSMPAADRQRGQTPEALMAQLSVGKWKGFRGQVAQLLVNMVNDDAPLSGSGPNVDLSNEEEMDRLLAVVAERMLQTNGMPPRTASRPVPTPAANDRQTIDRELQWTEERLASSEWPNRPHGPVDEGYYSTNGATAMGGLPRRHADPSGMLHFRNRWGERAPLPMSSNKSDRSSPVRPQAKRFHSIRSNVAPSRSVKHSIARSQFSTVTRSTTSAFSQCSDNSVTSYVSFDRTSSMTSGANTAAGMSSQQRPRPLRN